MRKGYLSINQDIIATNSLSKDVKNAALVATLAKKNNKKLRLSAHSKGYVEQQNTKIVIKALINKKGKRYHFWYSSNKYLALLHIKSNCN